MFERNLLHNTFPDKTADDRKRKAAVVPEGVPAKKVKSAAPEVEIVEDDDCVTLD